VITRRISKLGDAAVNTRYGKGGSKDIHKDSFLKRPDLLLIDGGEPQLAAAMKALQKLKIEEIGVAALAKKMEEIYMPGRRGAVCLPRDSEALRMLQRIRDEAHRYALTYHRLQRDKRARRSALDDIPGIGPKRKKYLMRHYGSLAGIAAASLEELQGLSFLDKKTAANVYSILCKSSGQENNMLEKE
jgi:excinuclease ABC subunit C